MASIGWNGKLEGTISEEKEMDMIHEVSYPYNIASHSGHNAMGC